MIRPRGNVLPLGCNCHLGAALSRFGHYESSLFRWADVSIERVVSFLEGKEVFAGRTAFRFAGAALGTLDHAEMRAHITDAPEGARVNTIVYDNDDEAYVHGVQLGLDEAAGSSVDRIRAANAEKVAFLANKVRALLKGPGSVVAIRLEWAPVSDPTPFTQLGTILRGLNPAAVLRVVAPAGGIEGERDEAGYVGLRSQLPPLSDVMNVAETGTELASLFVAWEAKREGAERPYIFDI
jgi:hypothetical protein